MIDQQMASIIKFILDASGNPASYYHKAPQNFQVPAVYFPAPQVTTGAETFNTYSVDYVWYIVFFDCEDVAAYGMGFKAADAIRAEKNLIPLVDETGQETGGAWVRVKDPALKTIDGGAAQLTLEWRDVRPYREMLEAEGLNRAAAFNVAFLPKGRELTDGDAGDMLEHVIRIEAANAAKTKERG